MVVSIVSVYLYRSLVPVGSDWGINKLLVVYDFNDVENDNLRRVLRRALQTFLSETTLENRFQLKSSKLTSFVP